MVSYLEMRFDKSQSSGSSAMQHPHRYLFVPCSQEAGDEAWLRRKACSCAENRFEQIFKTAMNEMSVHRSENPKIA